MNNLLNKVLCKLGSLTLADKLPDDPFGGEGERSIEDLIREDQELSDAEDAILDNEKKAGRTKKIVAACTGVLVLGAVVTAAFMYNPFDGSQTVGEKEPSTITNPSDTGGGVPVAHRMPHVLKKRKLFIKQKAMSFL